MQQPHMYVWLIWALCFFSKMVTNPHVLCLQAVGVLYCRPELSHVSHLDDNLEDLFDIGICPYFPMMFKPPKDNPAGITREQLLGRVVEAMGCCPQFAALAIPLLSEKLGSALRCVHLGWLSVITKSVCFSAPFSV
jgi:hypothetical protein